MEKFLELLFSNALGAVGMTVIGWLLTKYVEQLNSRIDENQRASLERIGEVAQRLNSIEAKYRDVLDIILDKFSRWEDRIAGLLSKLGGSDAAVFQSEVDKFREETTNDLFDLKLKIERVNVDIKKIVAEPIDETSKALLFSKLETTKEELGHKIKYIEDTLSKVVRLINTINVTQKEHMFKIENLVAMRGKNDSRG